MIFPIRLARSRLLARLGALAALVSAPLAARAQTAAVLPVTSADQALAQSVEASVREALLGATYLIQDGEPVATALAQAGLATVTSLEEGQRLARILGADLLVSVSIEPTWMSLNVMHIPSGSIEVREGALPPESVNLPATVVANLADIVAAMIRGGVALPEIAQPSVEPPPVEPPPVEPPPVAPPPVVPPVVPVPDVPPPVVLPPVEPPPVEDDATVSVIAGGVTALKVEVGLKSTVDVTLCAATIPAG